MGVCIVHSLNSDREITSPVQLIERMKKRCHLVVFLGRSLEHRVFPCVRDVPIYHFVDSAPSELSLSRGILVLTVVDTQNAVPHKLLGGVRGMGAATKGGGSITTSYLTAGAYSTSFAAHQHRGVTCPPKSNPQTPINANRWPRGNHCCISCRAGKIYMARTKSRKEVADNQASRVPYVVVEGMSQNAKLCERHSKQQAK